MLAKSILDHIYDRPPEGDPPGRDSRVELAFLRKLGQTVFEDLLLVPTEWCRTLTWAAALQGSRNVIMSLLRNSPVLDGIVDIIWKACQVHSFSNRELGHPCLGTICVLITLAITLQALSIELGEAAQEQALISSDSMQREQVI